VPTSITSARNGSARTARWVSRSEPARATEAELFPSRSHPRGGCLSSLGAITVDDRGGGINNGPGATLTVSGCTLSGNSAGSQGGGIWESNFAGQTLTLSNSVFTVNTPDNIFGSYTDGGGNTFS
jgi:hypothetical protein